MYHVEMATEGSRIGIQVGALREAMRRRGIDVAADLARMAGVHKSTVSLILSGKRQSASADIISKLARALGVSTDYLIGTSDQAEPTALMLGELLTELTQVARRLPSRRQRDLLLMARAYLEDGDNKAADPSRLMEDILDLVAEYGGEVTHEQLIDLLNALSGPDDNTLLLGEDTD